MQQRHRSDSIVNNRVAHIVTPEGEVKDIAWKNVIVGDIIKMENDQFVAVRHVTKTFQ